MSNPTSLEPFSVTAVQVIGLDRQFASFVSQLLDAERQNARLLGHQLTVMRQEDTADGGVDAATRYAVEGEWIPAGTTGWQFKRSDLGPTACAKELAGAEWAQSLLREGGSYVLALGAQLTDQKLSARQKAVLKQARDLGLVGEADVARVRVYDANQVARWASTFPALALSPLLGGPGFVAVDHSTWGRSTLRAPVWVADEVRKNLISDIQKLLIGLEATDLRLEGDSGMGKSRLALEALDHTDLRALVVYFATETDATNELINRLGMESRAALVVVDDCPAERHGKLANQLPHGGRVVLMTIGHHDGPALGNGPILALGGLAEEQRDEFLLKNYPTLSAEARRFVARNGEGNVTMMRLLARAIEGADEAHAAELIDRGDLEAVVQALLPERADFFASTVLAMLERVGFDRERRYQLELLSSFSGVSSDILESTALVLQEAGLIETRGRYRAVVPRPLAVYLASRAWQRLGDRFVTDLFSQLDPEMALAAFTRAADLGSYPPARDALASLIGPDGPFATLETIGASENAGLLPQLAVVLPEAMSRHIERLLDAAPPGALRRLTSGRRDLVWTLGKLVWHADLFESAADSLLRLALEENESYANNATGTWVELFGARLPGTAASPSQRAAYLEGLRNSTDSDTRTLVARAAAHGLQQYETIMVAGELQAGALVAARGTPRTYGEYWEYRAAMLSMLVQLSGDADSRVAETAFDAIVDGLHGLLRDERLFPELSKYASLLTGARLKRVRRELEHLRALYARKKDEAPEDALPRAQIDGLATALPPATGLDALEADLDLRRWDFPAEEYRARIQRLVAALKPAQRQKSLTLLEGEPQGAWELGYAYGTTEGAKPHWFNALSALAEKDIRPLIGYLWALHDLGDTSVFDDFLESPRAAALPLQTRVALSVRAPVSRRSRAVVMEGARELPVLNAVSGLFGWQDNLKSREVVATLRDWTRRATSQEEYNALVTWCLGVTRRRKRIGREMRAAIEEVVFHRLDLPDVRMDAYEWSHLAELLLPEKSSELASIIVELIVEHDAMIHHQPEGDLLVKAARAKPAEVWSKVAERLTAERGWRITMDLNKWFVPALPPALLVKWVGRSVRRARALAALVPVGGAEPGELITFLLTKFGRDAKVASALHSTFISGSWMGPESGRLRGQIRELTPWTERRHPREVRDWARNVLASLEARLSTVLVEEAEEHR